MTRSTKINKRQSPYIEVFKAKTQLDYLKQVLAMTLWPNLQNENIVNWELREDSSDSVSYVAYLIKGKFAFLENNSPLNG